MHRFLVFYLSFHGFSAILAQLQTQLNFYTDHQCQTLSTEHAAASISVSQCIVTPGLGSISHQPVPCQNGNVQLIAYQDASCHTQLGVLDWYKVTNQCSARYNGDIAAISLTCNQVSGAGTIDPGTPTTTSTVVVGQVADSGPTATPTASSNSPSSNNNGDHNGTSNSAGSNSTPSSGLSTHKIIAIALGIGFGFVILIGLGGALRGRKNIQHQETGTPLFVHPPSNTVNIRF